MIELHELSKRYGDTLAVDGLSFQVPRGVVTGFLGPNGAGKSTTMRMILDLDRPTSGRVTIDGKRYGQLSEPLKYIGALLEAKAVHPGRTAYDHLLWLAQSNRIPARRVNEVLDLVGLGSVARKRSRGFSLGMGQRLGIASALLGDPEIVMFDEPVNGLDPEGILWIRNLMKGLASEGRTVFVSSHLMSEMALTADHLVVIGRGRLLADLPMPEFIRQNSRSAVRIRTPHVEQLHTALAGAGLRAETGPEGSYEVVDGSLAGIGELAAAHGVVLHELSPQQASLEEAFMQMTADSVEYHAGDGEGRDAAGAWGAAWHPRNGRQAAN
ncbi:ATP-binding cassette domain-containing protein [Kitasatospora sp. GP82]|uniref:ATP-binding cassette domain-containing protein n=1 Tax=Kitasatospora sp. GP82 TaxID=3035089 RepID=UPI00247595CA|nr:ATP-binding cassette domain-containing protein [Kitasatospora sp. GP82]MDH6127995.1 ABC-2 type transport system ATP-binding protein [Kitasatospora sp. GP82]